MEPRRILLVEDNPSDVELTRRALRKNGIPNELVVAEDGQEALDYVFSSGRHAGRSPAEPPVLILLDLRLPKVDGLAVLEALKSNQASRRIPVVVLSTSNEECDLSAAYDLGVNGYIRKPVDFDRFVDAVKHVGNYWLVVNEAPPLPAVK